MNCSRWTALTFVAGIMLLGGCGSSAPRFNATPTISNLFPSNIVAGSDDFTLFVAGTGFVSSSEGASFLYWNGFPRSTMLNQVTGQLEVHIFAADVAAPRAVNVMIVNPAPGGGMSTPSTFTVGQNLLGAPVITSFSPPSANAGGAGFTLTVNGNNFAANDPVTWNGDVRATTFVNSSQVQAAILANDIASAGSGSVAVYTPGLVVGSPSVSYPITGPNNPAPSLSSLTPSSEAAGSADLEVLVAGSGFVQSSVGEWNGAPLATAFLSSSEMIVLIPAADLATGNTTANVDVFTPAPGGGTSKPLSFKVN